MAEAIHPLSPANYFHENLTDGQAIGWQKRLQSVDVLDLPEPPDPVGLKKSCRVVEVWTVSYHQKRTVG